MHFGPVSLLIGPAGPIVWQWSKHATPLSLPESLGNWVDSHQLHALKTCRSVLWYWAPLASNFHRGPHWQTESVRCLHEGMSRTSPRHGWQREVSMKVEQHFRDTRLMPTTTEPDPALLRSQGGPLAAAPFTGCPTDRLFRIEPQCFHVLLLRRLRLPLLFSQRNCRCGRPLDVLGHHRAACATAGVLGRRGFAVESVVARICREGGARVTTNMFVRNMDLLDFDWLDGRVADGLPLFGGAQLAIDATLVSAIKRDGTAREGAATSDGAGPNVPGVVGGRWKMSLGCLGWRSGRTMVFRDSPAPDRCPEQNHAMSLKSSARVPRPRGDAGGGNMLGCCAARAVAESLLGRKRHA